ncbi:unnamed protein product [Penicillium salamii]|nr:unnamed protein product [Penicillium salamii]CAG8578874.1 unnamed protein product [Penicillium salamii]
MPTSQQPTDLIYCTARTPVSQNRGQLITIARLTALYRLLVPSLGHEINEHRHCTRSPRGYSTPVSTLHKAFAYILFMAPSHQTT